ncbi:MAG TPA: glutathione S-transferase family protein, partial [Polyangiales bacterium]
MLTLYYHPLASYCWKVLIALFENDTPFERRIIDLGDAAHRAELSALWPLCKFPVLRVDDRVVAESSIIVEYLDRHHARGFCCPRMQTPRSTCGCGIACSTTTCRRR